MVPNVEGTCSTMDEEIEGRQPRADWPHPGLGSHPSLTELVWAMGAELGLRKKENLNLFMLLARGEEITTPSSEEWSHH